MKFSVLRYHHRRPRSQRFHQEHDYWNLSGRLRRFDCRCRCWRIRSWNLQERTDPRTRPSRLHFGCQAAHRRSQQDGFH